MVASVNCKWLKCKSLVVIFALHEACINKKWNCCLWRKVKPIINPLKPIAATIVDASNNAILTRVQ